MAGSVNTSDVGVPSPLELQESTNTTALGSEVEQQCKLVVGVAALTAQLVLLVVVLSALLLKRHRERPKRPWNIWILDILKQACSAGAGHAVGMFVAILAHIYSHGASECGWYFVVYFADCTLGLTLAIVFHKIVSGSAQHYCKKHAMSNTLDGKGHTEMPWCDALVESGNYGDPPSYKKWFIQAVFWMLCVVTARTIVGVVVISSIPALQLITTSMDRQFKGHPDLYIFTVMVGIPVFINIGQAWIQDQVLKWRHRKASKSKSLDHTSDTAATMSLQQTEVIVSLGGRRSK